MKYANVQTRLRTAALRIEYVLYLFLQCDRLVDFKRSYLSLSGIVCGPFCAKIGAVTLRNIQPLKDLYFPWARTIVIHLLQLKNYGRF
jgi:hypothetical protein